MVTQTRYRTETQENFRYQTEPDGPHDPQEVVLAILAVVAMIACFFVPPLMFVLGGLMLGAWLVWLLGKAVQWLLHALRSSISQMMLAGAPSPPGSPPTSTATAAPDPGLGLGWIALILIVLFLVMGHLHVPLLLNVIICGGIAVAAWLKFR